jgi:hypothetical protein
MEIINNSNQYAISYKPTVKRAIGVILMVVSAIPIYGFLGGFSNYSQVSPTVKNIGLLIALAVFTVGFCLLCLTKFIDFVVNKHQKNITLTEKNLFRTTQSNYGFAEVEEFQIVEHLNAPHGTIDYFILLLKDKSKKHLGTPHDVPREDRSRLKQEFRELNKLIW